MNPLIPTAYDVVWSILAAGMLAWSIAAFVSMLRTRTLNGLRFLAWFLLLIPNALNTLWLGPIVTAAQHLAPSRPTSRPGRPVRRPRRRA